MERICIPDGVRAILMQLNTAGYAAYAVGGCVRDGLRGQTPQDWDICTSAKPQETAACFASDRVLLTGERFGTVTLLRGDAAYEITTFRAECGYSDSRHPDSVEFLPELRGDLMRRDFTVNAMAADAGGNVTDLFAGRSDLQKGIIRCVGEPTERFSEDALRILRGLRFAARFGFSVAPETAEAMHAERFRLRQVSQERLRKELCGLLLGRNAARVLDEFFDVLCVILPELAPMRGFAQYNPHHCWDVWQHTLRVLEGVPAQETLRLAALLHDVAKPNTFIFDKNLVGHFPNHDIAGAAVAEEILKRLRFDNQTVHEVAELVRQHMRPLLPATERSVRRLLAAVGPEQARRLLALHRADRLGKGTEDEAALCAQLGQAEALVNRLLAEDACFSLRQLAVSGKDLIALGIAPGKRMGEILDALLQAVIAGALPNEHAALCAAACDYAQKELKN